MFKILRERLTEINGRLNMNCTDYILAEDGERFTIARLEAEQRKGSTTIIGNNGKEYELTKLIGTGLPPVKNQKEFEPIPKSNTQEPVTVNVIQQVSQEPIIINEAKQDSESTSEKKQDWVRNSEGWKNMFPFIALALLVIFIIYVVNFNPPWTETVVEILDKMKGLGG